MQNKFHQKLDFLLKNNSPFLLFRKPNSSLLELWADDQKGDFQFIFNRFDNQEKIIFKTEEVLHLDINLIENICGLELENSLINESIDYDDYIELINRTINELKSTETNKIVISRIKEIIKEKIDLAKSLINLHHNYPNAFLYLWYTPENGLWIGASPELLLSEKDLKIETVSLAGTLPKGENWTSKEIHEQQVVTDYIISKLNKAIKVEVDGPHTVDAGFFNHLKSYIKAEFTSYDDVEELLEELHPTPAVCGMPKDEAKKFILKNEGYDRKFYAGYFGFKMPNESLYFVNLRCAQIFKNKVKLYVGGGIMPDSNPIKEWEETELKSKTIGCLLK